MSGVSPSRVCVSRVMTRATRAWAARATTVTCVSPASCGGTASVLHSVGSDTTSRTGNASVSRQSC